MKLYAQDVNFLVFLYLHLVVLPGSLKYLLDSCLNTHISTHKVQFEEFKIISGKIFGIAKDALDVKGIGRVKLVYPVSGY